MPTRSQRHCPACSTTTPHTHHPKVSRQARGYDAQYARVRRLRFDPASEYYQDRCHLCGGAGRADDVLDHARTRENTLANLFRAHARCNAIKAGRIGGRMRG